VIHLEPDEIDLERFEALLERGRSAGAVGDATTASVLLGGALSLWRGRPLADLEYEPFARPSTPSISSRRTWTAATRTRSLAATTTQAGWPLAPA